MRIVFPNTQQMHLSQLKVSNQPDLKMEKDEGTISHAYPASSKVASKVGADGTYDQGAWYVCFHTKV